jgi:DNA polymerase-3 subunit epsilon
MHHTPIHVIDFEGTRSSGIVEYGVVTVVGAVIESTATRICAPEGSISDVDQRQHGISEASAAEQQSFTNEWERFAALRQSGPLCAHNAAVEDGLLCSVWSFPRESPNFANTDAPVATWGPWLDTLYLYRRIYPQIDSHKLEDLIRFFGLQPELDRQAERYCPAGRQRFHCALYDALASALLLVRLYSEPELNGISLPWMLLQSAASGTDRANFEQQQLFESL